MMCPSIWSYMPAAVLPHSHGGLVGLTADRHNYLPWSVYQESLSGLVGRLRMLGPGCAYRPTAFLGPRIPASCRSRRVHAKRRSRCWPPEIVDAVDRDSIAAVLVAV